MTNRRTFLQASLLTTLSSPLLAALKQGNLSAAEETLVAATRSGLIDAASLHVQQGTEKFQRTFGSSKSPDDIFLLASISKPISIAAVMKLYDQGQFDLNDPVKKFIPEFKGDGRDTITMRQLMTHVSGLPDQLPQNAQFRSKHAELKEFVDAAIQTPLLFPAGTKYSYSSMAILLATEVAMRLTGKPIARIVEENVYQPLEMKHSALGLGAFKLESVMKVQVENAAPESGSGAPSTKSWDWNSLYWRQLGAPWGTAHGSAADVAIFLNELLQPSGRILKPKTAQLMTTNQNPRGIRPRALGFDLGSHCGGPGCSEQTFGHTGSTGTLCWADPATGTTCVILTTLPGRAITPHPRKTASDQVARAANS
ncbi:serine hydrolase domain-containing protein [Thalassoglobus sp.]|uniref:serine hydrolase domain-containing protein n=1 Tax=Thalassoglobus sp. TaxID=2795869 RepID=UPI003AA86A01